MRHELHQKETNKPFLSRQKNQTDDKGERDKDKGIQKNAPYNRFQYQLNTNILNLNIFL